MNCAKRISARLFPLIMSMLCITGAYAAGSASPSKTPDTPAASASPAATPPRTGTYRMISVVPDTEITTSRRGRVTVRPRAIRLKLERETRLWTLRGAIAFVPEVEIDWDHSEQVEDTLVKLVGKFERNVRYELRVTGTVHAAESSLLLERGAFTFTLPASAPAVEFANPETILERASKQLVHVKMRDVDKVKLSVTEVPLITLFAPPRVQSVDRDGLTTAPAKPDTNPATRLPLLDTEAWNVRARELEPVLKGTEFAPLIARPVKTETDLFPEPGPPDKERRASLPLTWRESKAQGGTYLVTAEAVDPASPPATRQMQVTDLALSTKVSPSDVTVWVTRLSTGEPVAGASVFFATETARVWSIGKTDTDGVLRVANGVTAPAFDLQPGAVRVEQAEVRLPLVERIVAVTPEDSVWALSSADEALSTPRHVKTGADDAARAHVFTERGVYRPGDTVHFKVTARAPAGQKTEVPKPGTTCQVLIENPRGQVARNFTLPLNAFGTAHGSFALKAHEPLGQWSVEVRTPSAKPIPSTEDPEDNEGESEEDRRTRHREARSNLGTLWGETTFRMEEYVPPRHRVEVSFTEKTSGPERVVTGVISGVYYAGGPVKHGKVRWRVALTGTRSAVPGLAGYTAGIDASEETELLDAGEATLDAGGQLGIDVPLSAALADGRRAVSVTATVLDFDSRSATGEASWSSPPKYLVGISDEPRDIRDREPLNLTAVVVDRVTGKPVQAGEITVAVLRRAHTHFAKRNEDGDFYEAAQSVTVRAFEWTTHLKDGVAPVHLEPSGAGEYALEVSYRAPDGTTYASSRSFKMDWGYDYEGGDYCYQSSDHMGSKWYSERLHALSVTSDRGEYAPGETARLWVRAPRQPVAVLVAVEREQGITVQRVKLTADGQFELKIPDGWAPNVYVSVLASYGREGFPVYPTDADTLAPGYGHGYLSLPIKKERSKLTVGLKGAGDGVSALPGVKHTITVSVADAAGKPVEAEVALAAVDEAVLSLTGYATPTLDQLFAVGVPLNVRTFDTRSRIALQTPYRALTVRPLTGGDGGDGRQSKTRENFNPVACWQPALVTDANGLATAEFTLPDAMTAYRVFAVAIDRGERHGSIARPLVVKKPFYIEAGLPRFFTAGDRAKVFVAVFNQTGAAGTASLKVTAQGGLKVTVPDSPVAVAAGDRVQIPVDVEATEPVHARLEFVARLAQSSAGAGRSPASMPNSTSEGTSSGSAERSDELVDKVVLPVPVRERYTMKTTAVTGLAPETATTVKLDLPEPIQKLSDALARTGTAELTLSPLPALRLVGGLKYLLQYPYGCVEQTSSKVLPLVTMRRLASEDLVPGLKPEMTDPYAVAGIARLLSMQTESGGFGYWPGDGKPHPWGSAYATFTLSLAKEAGLEVPADALRRANKYLSDLVNEKNAETASAVPFAHYVLARAGQPAGAPHQLAALAGRFTIEERLLLWMAAARAGMKTEAKAGLEKVLAEMNGATLNGWHPDSFWTGGRTHAIALLAAAEIAPELPATGALSLQLFRSMGPRGYWYNNHETAWSLVALIRMLDTGTGTSPAACSYQVSTGAETRVELAPKANQEIHVDPLAFLKSPSAVVKREGKSLVTYRLAATYPYEGPEQTTGTRIERKYRRLAGDGPIRVGDLVEVELTLDLPRGYDYAALVDPLPAGFVAVNSALKSEPQAVRSGNDGGSYEYGNYVSTWRPAYLEIRDDRVVAFRNYGWRGKYRFTYVARAVCEGTFRVPPAKVEPMYQPEDAWFSTAAQLTIQPASK